eukprot:3868555-Pleurochrysis_carterae.AAC.2
MYGQRDASCSSRHCVRQATMRAWSRAYSHENARARARARSDTHTRIRVSAHNTHARKHKRAGRPGTDSRSGSDSDTGAATFIQAPKHTETIPNERAHACRSALMMDALTHS